MYSYKIRYSSELYHHGILGQKWGRRQGPPYPLDEGDHSAAERKAGWKSSLGRRRDESPAIRKEKRELKAAEKAEKKAKNAELNKEFLKKAAIVAAGVATVKYFKQHPEKLEAIKKGATDRLVKAGDAALNGAMVAVGGIAIAELAERYSPTSDDSKATAYAKTIGLEAVNAGIRSATGASGGSSYANSKANGSVGADISSKLGPPSNKGVDKQGTEWQSLFKDIAKSNMPNEEKESTRATIKSLANAGYDMDQIKEYYNSVIHSGIGYRITFISELSHREVGGKSWAIKLL